MLNVDLEVTLRGGIGVSDRYCNTCHTLSALAIKKGAAFLQIGINAVQVSDNDVATMPSVHFAVTWLIVLASRSFGNWARWIALGYALLMLWAIVYGGEHYLIDAVVGMLVAWGCWRVCWWYTRDRKSTRVAEDRKV